MSGFISQSVLIAAVLAFNTLAEDKIFETTNIVRSEHDHYHKVQSEHLAT